MRYNLSMSEESKTKPSPNPKFKRLSEVEVPPEEVRFSTGIGGLDACLAQSEDSPQGVPEGTSILLAGMPGGGKSTIATYMSAAQHGRDTLYLHGEEKAERVKERWNRLGLQGADPYVVPLRNGEDALEVVRELNSQGNGLGMVIIDSVQTAFWGGKRKYDAQYEFVEAMVGQVTSAKGCLVAVSHVSKTGNDHAGAAALAHLVDIHLHLNNNAKKSTRELEVRKNRTGRAGFSVPLNVLANGLSVGVPAPLAAGGGHAMARSQLEKSCELAIASFLEGKRLDGYDFDVAGVSGGMWRAALEMAVKRMVRDGYSVLESKVKGRRGYELAKDPAGNVLPPKKEDAPVAVAVPVAIDDGNNLVPSDVPQLKEKGPHIVANGDKKKFSDEPEPGKLPIELD